MIKPIFVFIFISIILLKIKEISSCTDSQVVTVAQGRIQGNTGLSRNKRTFCQFFGVPYAKVVERFEVSVLPDNWEEVKLAVEFGPTCTDDSLVEDCLNLNIFTPKINSENGTLLPTVIFVHGGSFQANSNRDFGPNYLMDEDVVLVVINYRLGALGFLSTGDNNSPGNNGLKDQVMAMRWVQENIINFGGDKNNVTLMGQSAGAVSVTYHLVSPMSQGLFHKAVAQSGTFLDPWAFTRNPLPVAKRLAELLDCNTTSTKEMVDCLKKVHVEDIGKFKWEAMVKWHEEPLAGFGPVIEPEPFNNNTFLSRSPYELLLEGNLSNNVPLLTGVTDQEGIYLWAGFIIYGKNQETLLDLQSNWTGVAPVGFYFDDVVPEQRWDEVSLKIRDFYFGSEQINNATYRNLVDLYSDRLFINSAVRFINLYAKHAPVYPYLYTFNKYWGLEFGDWTGVIEPIGATHAAELDMLISPFFNQTRDFPDHNALSVNMVKLWTSFMCTGTPSQTFGSEASFDQVNTDEGLQKWYKLDTDTELVDNIFANRTAFWESLELVAQAHKTDAKPHGNVNGVFDNTFVSVF